MMHRAVLVGVVLLALVFSPLHGAAQSNPRLGTWKLNLAKSKYEHGVAPKDETRTYSAWQGDGVSVSIVATTMSGEKQTTTFSNKYDGKDNPYRGPAGDTISVKGDGVTSDAVVKKAGKVTQTTHSVVSKDGKTMTMMASYPDNAKTDMRIYDKQ